MLKFNITEEYIIAKSKNFIYMDKLAIFDLDYTLIKPKSDKKFSIDPDDWKFLYTNVPEKLEEYYNRNYTIIVITNQLKMKFENLEYKLQKIYKKLGIEIMFLIANKKNKFRKPCPSFFYDIIENNNNNKNFYCGDAAGRTGDHSDCDYKFALNCTLNFKLPEEIFNNKTNIILPYINYPNIESIKGKLNFTPTNGKEIIIMIGYPASGKSTISKKINEFYNYEIINQDTLKTKAKCHKMVKELIIKGKSLIVDNTNPTIETRKFYIDIARENDYYITCIYMQTSLELSIHNNHFRNNYKTNLLIPEIAYRIFKSKFEKPKEEEGFNRIIEQNIVFDKIHDPKYLYYLY